LALEITLAEFIKSLKKWDRNFTTGKNTKLLIYVGIELGSSFIVK
jgi:hypothetical protein